MRRELPDGEATAIAFDEESKWLRAQRGPFQLIGNFADRPVELPGAGVQLRLSTDPAARLHDERLELPPRSGVVTQR